MGAIKTVMRELYVPKESARQNDAGEGVTVRRRMHCQSHKVPSLERERVPHKRAAHDKPEDVRFEDLPDYPAIPQ